jgi:hypothetical protein
MNNSGGIPLLEHFEDVPAEDPENFHCIFDFEASSPSPLKKSIVGTKRSKLEFSC